MSQRGNCLKYLCACNSTKRKKNCTKPVYSVKYIQNSNVKLFIPRGSDRNVRRARAGLIFKLSILRGGTFMGIALSLVSPKVDGPRCHRVCNPHLHLPIKLAARVGNCPHNTCNLELAYMINSMQKCLRRWCTVWTHFPEKLQSQDVACILLLFWSLRWHSFLATLHQVFAAFIF